MEFTQGPWSIGIDCASIESTTEHKIIFVPWVAAPDDEMDYSIQDSDELLANANLASASPELLAASEMALRMLMKLRSRHKPTLGELDALEQALMASIAKATGMPSN